MVYQKEVIEEVLKELAREISVKEISDKYQISESTIYSWQKKYSNELEYKKLCVKTSKTIKKLIKIDIYEALNLSMQPCFQDCFFIL